MTLLLSGTNGLSDVDGTAATPAVRGTDANTGMFFPAADTIAFAEGGVEVARFDSSGNMGIGTASPSNKLVIAGGVTATGAASTYNIDGIVLEYGASISKILACRAGGNYSELTFSTAGANSSGGVTERMKIDSSGNVGIGTSSPDVKLDVDGGVGNTAFRLNSASNASQVLIGLATGDAYRATFSIANSSSDLVIKSEDAGGRSAGIQFWTGNASAERARISSAGKLEVGFGTQIIVPSGVSQDWIVGSTSDSQGFCSFRDGNSTPRGSIVVNPSAGTTSFNTTSDYRLKEDVKPLFGALAKVQLLKPCTYKWKDNGSAMEGFIAHELAEVCPQAVSGQKDAVDAEGKPVYQGIDTSFLVATLTAALQEQQIMIEQLKADVAALKGTV